MTALRAHPEWTGLVAREVLGEYFSPTLHEGIAAAAGLVLGARRVDRTELERDSRFRDLVLDAYGARCAICGFDARVGGTALGLEAAHARWHCSSGPSILANGVCLCALHHVALDQGALGISTDRRVMISGALGGGPATDAALRRWNGHPVEEPRRGESVAAEFVAWHAEHRFRAPAWTGTAG